MQHKPPQVRKQPVHCPAPSHSQAPHVHGQVAVQLPQPAAQAGACQLNRARPVLGLDEGRSADAGGGVCARGLNLKGHLEKEERGVAEGEPDGKWWAVCSNIVPLCW